MGDQRKRYGVILADPEWRFETGLDRAADNHPVTWVTEVIKPRPVESLAAHDCVLFLWTTAPLLPQALDAMKGWGFAYRSHFIWAKDQWGAGYWNRSQHELLLLGTKGDIPAPASGAKLSSLITAPVGRYAEKPDIFYELIESYFPNVPRIELNARRLRPGWDASRLEAPPDPTAA